MFDDLFSNGSSLLIFILIAVSLVVSIVTMVLAMIALKRISTINKSASPIAADTSRSGSVPVSRPAFEIGNNQPGPVQAEAPRTSQQSQPIAPVRGVVFCRNCGIQYESTLNACPSCQTPR